MQTYDDIYIHKADNKHVLKKKNAILTNLSIIIEKQNMSQYDRNEGDINNIIRYTKKLLKYANIHVVCYKKFNISEIMHTCNIVINEYLTKKKLIVNDDIIEIPINIFDCFKTPCTSDITCASGFPIFYFNKIILKLIDIHGIGHNFGIKYTQCTIPVEYNIHNVYCKLVTLDISIPDQENIKIFTYDIKQNNMLIIKCISDDANDRILYALNTIPYQKIKKIKNYYFIKLADNVKEIIFNNIESEYLDEIGEFRFNVIYYIERTYKMKNLIKY